jgi:predicted phage-related endonuclease
MREIFRAPTNESAAGSLRQALLLEKAMSPQNSATSLSERRTFIGGSDARIIMGEDEAALLRLWREKRGEIEPGGTPGWL